MLKERKKSLASWPVRKTTTPPPALSRGQYCGLSINSDVMADEEFYLRYYVGHKGKFGHEFLEFEFRSDGRLRYANNSNYKNDTMIRKEGTRAARHPTPPYPTLPHPIAALCGILAAPRSAAGLRVRAFHLRVDPPLPCTRNISVHV